MSGPDLSPLERVARQAGLPGLRARLVPPDPRTGRWFAWTREELLVSERVVDRCAPRDGEALLLNAIVHARRGGLRARPLVALGVLALLGGAHAWLGAERPGLGAASALAGIAALAAAAIVRARATLAADDETVRLLGGDAEPLVRALNAMDTDEIVLGARRLKARPDLHRRAERLARKHGLCAGGLPGEPGG